VLTHGFTVDAHGRKMSKSMGNVVAPQKVVNSLGADVLRLWVAATDYRGEMGVSDEILKRMADSYRRMRNTARFLLANLNGFDPAQHLGANGRQMLALDRWAVDRARRLQEEILEAYESIPVPPDLPEDPQLLLGGHGQLVSGHHQGSPVHHPAR
jgi:isoleucyl-tRNA synthetase